MTAAGYTPTMQDRGADATDSDINGSGRTDVVNLSSGENETTVDAGLDNDTIAGGTDRARHNWSAASSPTWWPAMK